MTTAILTVPVIGAGSGFLSESFAIQRMQLI
jgi:hypothetical protein